MTGQTQLLVVDATGRTHDASAIVWRADGVLVTAAHAVEGATAIELVSAPGEAPVTAEVTGVDRLSDIAVLRAPISARSWQPLPHAAAPARIAQRIFALGAPLGYGDSITGGVVSALDRRERPASPYKLIQHDAALNPGSSGGPLVDEAGRLLGMNVAIADGSRRHVGISFAAPAALLERIVPRLLAHGHIPRPALGMRLRDATREMRSAMPELETGGAVIEAVEPDGPAARAGLAGADIVLRANGRAVHSLAEIAEAIEPLGPGQGVDMTLQRGGKTLQRHIILGEAQHPPRTDPTEQSRPRDVIDNKLGLSFDGAASIIAVAPGSPAAAAGLAPGDRLAAVGGQAISNEDAVLGILRQARGKPIALLIERAGISRYVLIPREFDGAALGANKEAAGGGTL